MAFYLLTKRTIPVILLLMISCARDIELDIPDSPPELVVDAWIEIGKPAMVLLTATVNFSEPIDSSSYLNVVMTRAKVSVIEDGVTEVMTLRKDTSYFPPHIYMSNKTRGKIGSEYTIVVEYNGQTVTGTSTILPPPEIDSAWFALDKEQDSLGFIWLKIRDRQHENNYYRVRTMRTSKDSRYYGAQVSAYNDQMFPSEEFAFPVYRGLRNISDKLREHRFIIGDTVSVMFSSIGKAEYNCWTYFDRAMLNTSNPFATGGSNMPSNLSNGFGIWVAYGSTAVTVICQ